MINQINHKVLPMNPAIPQTGKPGITVEINSAWANKYIIEVPMPMKPNHVGNVFGLIKS